MCQIVIVMIIIIGRQQLFVVPSLSTYGLPVKPYPMYNRRRLMRTRASSPVIVNNTPRALPRDHRPPVETGSPELHRFINLIPNRVPAKCLITLKNTNARAPKLYRPDACCSFPLVNSRTTTRALFASVTIYVCLNTCLWYAPYTLR